MMMMNTKQKRQRFVSIIYFISFNPFIKTEKDVTPETPKSESKEAAVTREEKKERKVSIPILDLQMGNPEINTEEETEEGKRGV